MKRLIFPKRGETHRGQFGRDGVYRFQYDTEMLLIQGAIIPHPYEWLKRRENEMAMLTIPMLRLMNIYYGSISMEHTLLGAVEQ